MRKTGGQEEMMQFKMLPGGEAALEKWRRLSRPKELADYGLSINEKELRLFPDGRKMLSQLLRIQRNTNGIRSMTLPAAGLREALLADIEEAEALNVLHKAKEEKIMPPEVGLPIIEACSRDERTGLSIETRIQILEACSRTTHERLAFLEKTRLTGWNCEKCVSWVKPRDGEVPDHPNEESHGQCSHPKVGGGGYTDKDHKEKDSLASYESIGFGPDFGCKFFKRGRECQ